MAPEITTAMYCRQQIGIPPTFPYLLRQYAKACIRSQPMDILSWSAAYFRSLALGIPPPVKLRLEYPIPKMHYGLTPGWLKTLIYQLAGFKSVTWPQLYDRWKGACLQIEGLKEILLLANFKDPVHIPWYRFVAIAAGHLTQNLAATMILCCELLTQEPEGGSSMIPYPIFADLYRFLALIDARESRIQKNYFFTESNLNLYKLEEIDSDLGTEKIEEIEEVRIEEEETEILSHMSDLRRYLDTIGQGVGEAEDEGEEKILAIQAKIEDGTAPEKLDTHSSCYIILDPDEDEKVCKELHSKSTSSDESSESTEVMEAKLKASQITFASEEESYGSEYRRDATSKASIDMSSTITPSLSYLEVKNLVLPAVLGIGARQPAENIEKVLKYLKNCAKIQEGMVMPRNIRHFLCPPLEVCEEVVC